MRSTLRHRWLVLLGAVSFVGMIVTVSLADEADEASCAQQESGDACRLSGGAIGICQADDVDPGQLECDPPGLGEVSSRQP